MHDFIILVASVRHDGISLPRLARAGIGRFSGLIASLATLFIVVCTLASVATVVVNALSESAWGMFTILVTIVAALITGLWMYRIRPGRVGEASAVGVAIVLLGVFLGKPFAESGFGHLLLFDKPTLSLLLPAYALIASILPVWILMCPRDYLSSYMKVGVMVVLGVGLIAAHPPLKMPPLTPFTGGGGPVISGAVWPFLCIVVMCGAISGFHALVASGTTPKMIYRESDIKPIGFGAMLTEGFVAVLALIAACALHPGDYFVINAPQDTPAQKTAYIRMVQTQEQAGWKLQPQELRELEEGTREKLVGRTGGAVTLAVGMAKVFSSVAGLKHMMSYWYHFVIMFEALFILTLLETGTRVARFVFQEVVQQFRGESAPTGGKPNWTNNVVMSFVTCFSWGYLLYSGNLNTLWTMLGIANQLLASIALIVGTTYILLHAPRRIYALCTALPLAFLLATTLSAGTVRVLEWAAQVPVLRGTAPGQVFYQELLVVLAAAMIVMTVLITLDALNRWRRILAGEREPARVAPAPASR